MAASVKTSEALPAATEQWWPLQDAQLVPK
jgi:hypothetical protein